MSQSEGEVVRNIFSKNDRQTENAGWRDKVLTKAYTARRHYRRVNSLYRNRKRLGKAAYSVMYLITHWNRS